MVPGIGATGGGARGRAPPLASRRGGDAPPLGVGGAGGARAWDVEGHKLSHKISLNLPKMVSKRTKKKIKIA